MATSSEQPRVAVVTGAARGIGLAIALRLLGDGLAVTVIDVNPKALEALATVARDHPGRFHYDAASVTDRAAIDRVMDSAIERWGSLDVLVNNAGVNRPGSLLTQTESDWDDVVTTNLKGAFVCSAAAAARMKPRKRGAIVCIGSIAGAGIGGGNPAYSASKAGLIGLTKQMAVELGPDGITANLVAPGITLTGWVARNLPEASREAARTAAPLRRLGEPEDIAAAVAFLASPDARHITGQVLSVSGGHWMP